MKYQLIVESESLSEIRKLRDVLKGYRTRIHTSNKGGQTRIFYKNNKPWSEDDDAYLIEMYNKGISYKKMSFNLERTASSTQQRIFKFQKSGLLKLRNNRPGKLTISKL